jgi:hypothetical protein
MTKNNARILFLRCMAKLIAYAEAEDIRFLVYTFYRSAAEQAQKVNERKSQVNYSQHQDWLAIDILLLDENDQAVWTDHPDYHRLGEIWKGLHPLCRWGGDWKTLKDFGHYELSREWKS